MIELKEKPLKRGIPCSRFYLELHTGHLEIKVRGSRMPGIKMEYMTIAAKAPVPGSAPAKCFHGLDYLIQIADKAERRKEKAHDRRATDHNT